jgi:hypothetical protein
MELVVVAPTASHDLTLSEVEVVGDTAEVTMTFITPGDVVTAQILSQVRASVPASRLGDTDRVRFWIATEPRDGAPGEPVLSVIQTR